MGGGAGVTYALEAAVVGRVHAPSGEAGGVELPIMRADAGLLDTGAEVAWKRHGGSLPHAVDLFAEDEEMVGGAG